VRGIRISDNMGLEHNVADRLSPLDSAAEKCDARSQIVTFDISRGSYSEAAPNVSQSCHVTQRRLRSHRIFFAGKDQDTIGNKRITRVTSTRALQPVVTCRQSSYLHKPAIVFVTSFLL